MTTNAAVKQKLKQHGYLYVWWEMYISLSVLGVKEEGLQGKTNVWVVVNG